MINEVLNEIREKKLIENGDVVLAGVSGGADSVSLFLVLEELRKKMDFTLWAVHVEHGIRGEESRKDARFVETLCNEKHVFCKTYFRNVPSVAAEEGIGLEEAARKTRYDCYRNAACEAAEKFPGKKIKIALAHHAQDNAETVLFQMVRGSGLDGLCGMSAIRPWNGFFVIRPLLTCSRAEIEKFLSGRGQEFCVDATNTDTDYSRNRIRHKVLPQLNEINGQAVRHINQSAALLQQVRDYLNEVAEKMAQECVAQETDGIQIKGTLWQETHTFLQQEVIHRAIEMAAGSKKDITAAHVEAVRKLGSLQVGREIELPYQMTARRNYEGVCLQKREEERAQAVFCEIPKERLEKLFSGETIQVLVPQGKICLCGRSFTGEIGKIHKKTYTKWLNYDKIKGGLQIRTKSAGDYLTIDESGHTKKLKDYLVNEKVPAKERENLLLVTEESHVIWVVGKRISADYKVNERTKRVLRVQFFGGKNHESQEY